MSCQTCGAVHVAIRYADDYRLVPAHGNCARCAAAWSRVTPIDAPYFE